MRGVATRYIILFVLGIISLMVALDIFFTFTGFFQTFHCKLYSLRRALFHNEDPIMAERCASHDLSMETQQVPSGTCQQIAEGMAPYLMACWEKSWHGKASKDIWCYELYLQGVPDGCTNIELAGNLTEILSSTGPEVNDNSYLSAEITKGEYPVYIFYNSTNNEVGII